MLLETEKLLFLRALELAGAGNFLSWLCNCGKLLNFYKLQALRWYNTRFKGYRWCLIGLATDT